MFVWKMSHLINKAVTGPPPTIKKDKMYGEISIYCVRVTFPHLYSVCPPPSKETASYEPACSCNSKLMKVNDKMNFLQFPL